MRVGQVTAAQDRSDSVSDQAVVIARADGSVPFYDARAADELGLPYPPREVDLDHLRDAYETLREDGSPLRPDERPIARALRERRTIKERLHIRRGNHAGEP